MVRIGYIIFGLFALGLSYIGIVLPGFPAIPFIILTFYFFSNSSDKLTKFLEESKMTKGAMHKIRTNLGKKWFAWFVISQFWVSMIVAERIAIRDWWWSSWWYSLTLFLSLAIYFLMKKKLQVSKPQTDNSVP